MDYKKVATGDGTYTLHSKRFDECYHSTKDGALQESLQKHVIPAFTHNTQAELTILDICFGLGYNTFATIYHILRNGLDIKVRIIAPEFDEKLLESLRGFTYPEEFAPFSHIIDELLRNHRYKDERFDLRIAVGDAREVVKNLRGIDIVYQDAFSPKKNPLLWTKEYFADIKKAVSNKMVLTTYSVATGVRMGLYENGFFIYEARGEGVRTGTIASNFALELPAVDMELKKRRNPAAAPLLDREFS